MLVFASVTVIAQCDLRHVIYAHDQQFKITRDFKMAIQTHFYLKRRFMYERAFKLALAAKGSNELQIFVQFFAPSPLVKNLLTYV